jgi:lipoprotein NlpI
MGEVYQMFRGAIGPERVLAAARASVGPQFYAHLYMGLYFEAVGRGAEALEHIKTAAADKYAAVGGYMHRVAQVHLMLLQRGGSAGMAAPRR